MLIREPGSIIDEGKLIVDSPKTPDEIPCVHVNLVDLAQVTVRDDNISIRIHLNGIGVDIVYGTVCQIYMFGLVKSDMIEAAPLKYEVVIRIEFLDHISDYSFFSKRRVA